MLVPVLWLRSALTLTLLSSATCSAGSSLAEQPGPDQPPPTVPEPSSIAAAPEPEPEPELTPEPEPEPAPEPERPLPFADREQVRVDELLAAIVDELEPIAASPAVRSDYQDFLAGFELEDSEALYQDYVRIKVAFEATRDGGWWGLEWQITNEEPRSDLVWAQWAAIDPATLADGLPATTAIAECDELSALFAFVARRIGLRRSSEVGLLWPTGNHVVAVWTIDAKSEHPTRVVVPTTQIFLDADASLGTDGFNPWKQRTIYDYRRQDAKGDLALPAALARGFIAQIRAHGGRSQAELLTRLYP